MQNLMYSLRLKHTPLKIMMCSQPSVHISDVSSTCLGDHITKKETIINLSNDE